MRPGDDDGVGLVQDHASRHVGDVEVGGEGMRGMLFLDVGKDRDVVRAKVMPIAQHRARRGLSDPFIRDVGVGPALGADKVAAGGLGYGQRRFVALKQHVQAHRRVARPALDGVGHAGHRSGDLRPHLALVHARKVEHILDQDAVDAGGQIDLGLGDSPLDGALDTDETGHARARPGVDHRDDRLRFLKKCRERDWHDDAEKNVLEDR